ncbi:Wzz/FepE/Etk N-terminal domain-containing protein [Streptococcaceae bacterium ESL0729]|nr:Wzz/FepE/Etk N-terminal domain-containing protein [Streptococcaceae bacterium ESL0729]
MEEKVNVHDIFEILKKHLSLIIITGLMGLGLAAFVTFFVVTPKYSSQSQLIVTLPQADKTTNANDVNGNLQMINTYKTLVTGDLVINQVKEKLSSDYGLSMTSEELRRSISVNQTQNSLMFSISAKTDNPISSEHIANTTAQVFKENVKDVMNVDKISIISKAEANLNPVSPSPKKNLAIGALVGLFVGVGLSFILEQLDRTVKDSRFITDSLGLTILGTVPQMTAKELSATYKGKKPVKEERFERTTNDSAAADDQSKRRRRSRV